MEEERLMQGQVEIFRQLFAFADSMALKCAVELGIADIIHRNGRPMTLHQIAAELPTTSPDTGCLFRIMRLLVRKHVFVQHDPPTGDGINRQPEFGLTPASRWLVKDGELSMAPMVLWENHPCALAPWHCFSKCVQKGGAAFDMAYGVDIWGYAAVNPKINQLLNSAMACTTKIIVKVVIAKYEYGFSRLGSLVDVGGGTGAAIAEIVKVCPHLKGINLDLPHVVATAPEYQGITHVAGDMFVEIPKADAVFMKWILHDWSDEHCIKILKQCKKAIPHDDGKVIIVDGVLQSNVKEDAWQDTKLVFDVTMMAHTSGGKERTEVEWRKLLKDGGFNRCNIITLPTISSLIEAFPN